MYKIIKYTILVIAALVFLVPFWFLIVSSFRDSSSLLSYPPELWPQTPTLKNYLELLSGQSYPFVRWLFNSILCASATTAGVLFVCSLGGYAFAKIEFPGKKVLFTVAMATLMVPAAVVLIPQFMVIKDLKLINTLPGILLPGVASSFGLFLMKQFIEEVPDTLSQAAMVDGGNHFIIYSRIVVPIIKPASAVLAIFTFMSQWNNLIWPLIVAQSENAKTIQVGIAGMKTISKVPWGQIMAASVISFLPIFTVFMMSRDKFIAGMTAGAVKG